MVQCYKLNATVAILRQCLNRHVKAEIRHQIRQSFSTAALITALFSVGSASFAGSTVTVGNPSSPNSLGSAINTAYTGGATTINIAPGNYSIAASGEIDLNNWSNATISCYGCTFDCTDTSGNDSLWTLNNCTNVTLEGGTITGSVIPIWESKITSLGAKDKNGNQTYNISQVTGYPAPAPGSGEASQIVDGNSRQYEPFTGDFYSTTITSTGSGTFNVDFNQGYSTLAVGEYVIGRNGDPPYKIHLQKCTTCTVENVTMYQNGFSALREDNCKSDTFNHVIWAAGPPPSGATDPPLFSCAADGSDALADYTGPTYENCKILELLNDDDIAIHGYSFPVNSVSGTTVTFEDSVLPGGNDLVVGQPLRFADAKFYVQGNVTGVTNNGTVSTVTLDKNYSIPSDAFAFNPDVCGANYTITNCLLGSTRSRGIIAKADNGWIEGNTIINSGIDAVRVGNDGWNDEAGFANNVDVLDNVIDGNGAFQFGGDGALHVGITGATGNFNYLLENNVISNSAGPSVTVEGGDNIQISNNTFANTSQYSQSNDNHLLNVTTSDGVTMANNLLTNRGANSVTPYYEIDSSSTNVNTSGLTTGTLNSGVYTLNHYTTNQNVDVPGNSGSSGVDLDTQTEAQDTEQCWVAYNALNGFYALTHLGTNLVMDVPNNTNTPGTYVDQASYGGTNDNWSIADQGNGTELLLNDYSGLALDAIHGGTGNGTAVDEYTSNSSNAQRWTMWLAGATAGPNLVQNFSFEGNEGFTFTPNGWAESESPNYSAYVQAQSLSEDGPNCLVMYNSSAYNATVYQTITGLQNGYYTLTAYVAGNSNMNQAYMFASNYGTNAPELEQNAPLGSNIMKQITIANIYVSNGQCMFGFYGQTGIANTPFFVDNVSLTREFSTPAQVDLTPNLNDIGLVADGTDITTGGFDGANYGLSSNLLGGSQSWDGQTFTFGGGLSNYNVVNCDGSTIALPPSPYTYSKLYILAAAVNGAQSNQNFTINYSSGTPQSITQSFSDWCSPQNFNNESDAVPMTYRDTPGGTKQTINCYVYGYGFTLDNTRMPLGINLPINSNLKILAVTLAP